jgi:hypothetical protein
MIEKYIQKHKKDKIEQEKNIRIEHISTIDRLFGSSSCLLGNSTSVGMQEERSDLADDIERIMDDIPRVKPLKTTNKYTKYSEKHRYRNEEPCLFCMIVPRPIRLHEF